MKTYLCPKCNKKMEKIDEIHLVNGKVKYGLVCLKHKGIRYWHIEKGHDKVIYN